MIDTSKMTEEERKTIEARREYHRKWRAAHKDKVQENNKRFYKKKAMENNCKEE